MGTLLQRMYDTLHIITNFSAINDSIQKQNDSFNTSHITILFVKYQKKRCNNYVILFIL